jgi:CRISPR/Cas system CSM-associated protein Csm3 (group 7 of RAMP superfamily)
MTRTTFWDTPGSREIRKRIVVEGRLTLLSPTHLGNGDADTTDMMLLRDASDRMPLLTGSTLAGALRAYLRRVRAFGQIEADLFGMTKSNFDQQDGEQSRLIIDDCVAIAGQTAIRDGVALDPKTRTAADTSLFSIEVWQPGLSFNLRFELLIYPRAARLADAGPAHGGEDVDEITLRNALAAALTGLSNDGITLGARKKRGYGRIRADQWTVREYDMSAINGQLAWLASTLEPEERKRIGVHAPALMNGLQTLGNPGMLSERRVDVSLTLQLDSGMLLRGAATPEPATDGDNARLAEDVDDHAPDAEQLTGKVVIADGFAEVPIVSGSSWAGALRARCARIERTLGPAHERIELTEMLFGCLDAHNKTRQRAVIGDHAACALEHVTRDHVQSRVSIDRLSGGAYEGALFSERAALPLTGATTECRLTVFEGNDQADAQLGLLLLALKDLMLGDIALGGTGSIGRGRLSLRTGRLERHRPDGQVQAWTFTRIDDAMRVNGDDRAALNAWVAAARTAIAQQQAAQPMQHEEQA